MINSVNKNFWLFGAGYWAQVLIKKINLKFPNDNVYVIDPNSEAINNLVSQNLMAHPSTLDHFRNSVKFGDYAFVVTPPSSHYMIAKESLLLGCHTWVEKPLTTSAPNARELLKIATDKNVTLFVDNTFLFDPLILSLKELSKQKIYKIHSRRLGWGKILVDLGVLWDLLPHDLSIINYIFGEVSQYKLISADFGLSSSNLASTALAATVSLMTVDNLEVQIDLSVISRNKIRQIDILSTEKLITYNLTSTGTTLSSTRWDNIPGLSKKILVEENYASNSEDNLANAIDCFIKLSDKGVLHDSMKSAVREITIIQELSQQALNRYKSK